MGGSYRLEDGRRVTASQLSRLGKEKQIGAMREWFFDNFSDPNILPHDSGEGGFQWIWGGPYDARDELSTEFSGVVKDSAISELASDLSDENWEWSGNPDNFEPDDEEYYKITLSRLPAHAVLEISLAQIEDAAKHKLVGETQEFVQRLLFANAITVLETYLSDRFRKTIEGNPSLVQKFVETFPGMKERQIPLTSASAVARNLEKLVISELNKVMWHRLDKVGKMYEDTLGVAFPPDLTSLEKAIKERHDIVHRNGKSEDGQMGTWDRDAIISAVKAVRKLADHVENKLAHAP